LPYLSRTVAWSAAHLGRRPSCRENNSAVSGLREEVSTNEHSPPSSRGAAAHVTARARVAALAKRIALPSAAAALALACLPAAANRALSQTDARQSAASAAPAPPQTPPARSPTPQPLNEQERRGQAIYVGGESASGPEVTAAVGQIDVPAEMLSCAGCHGRRGEGKTEGGVAAGALAWTHLTKPSGHTHPTGRKHGPFDESSFAKAITSGTDSSGNQLLTAMPRYRMTAEQMADLVSYLKRIEGDRDPRVTDTTLAVGMLVPPVARSPRRGRPPGRRRPPTLPASTSRVASTAGRSNSKSRRGATRRQRPPRTWSA
jgi:mono/diheme cytochrome c family protein